MFIETLWFSGSLGWEGQEIWSARPTADNYVNGEKLMITREILAAPVSLHHCGWGITITLCQRSWSLEHDLCSFFIPQD